MEDPDSVRQRQRQIQIHSENNNKGQFQRLVTFQTLNQSIQAQGQRHLGSLPSQDYSFFGNVPRGSKPFVPSHPVEAGPLLRQDPYGKDIWHWPVNAICPWHLEEFRVLDTYGGHLGLTGQCHLSLPHCGGWTPMEGHLALTDQWHLSLPHCGGWTPMEGNLALTD